MKGLVESPVDFIKNIFVDKGPELITKSVENIVNNGFLRPIKDLVADPGRFVKGFIVEWFKHYLGAVLKFFGLSIGI